MEKTGVESEEAAFSHLAGVVAAWAVQILSQNYPLNYSVAVYIMD